MTHDPAPIETEPFKVTSSGLQVRPGVSLSDSYPRPDFVIVGVRKPGGGVMLFASVTLTQAELKRETDPLDPFDFVPTPGGLARLPKEDITVSAKMRDFTLIHADSYPEALRSLHEQWARQAPQPGNALPPGT